MDFSSLRLHQDLIRAVRDLGFSQATPIQERAIPPALQGRDLLACAMTGSGKTAAFALPILERLRSLPRGTTRALVITPTRELAAQINDHLKQLGAHTTVRSAAVFGGVGMQPQEAAFRRGIDVIVATPGRLLDHFQYSYARLSGLEVLVIDEADRMLDMGFLPDIRRILRHIPKPKQTLFFSATMPREIATLAREILRDPVTIDVERPAAPATGVSQAVYFVPHERKVALLLELLKGDGMKRVLAFTRTKHRANKLHDLLSRHGVSVARIHGNRSQAQRTLALDGFKRGDHRVLVATDIAARGIDVEALSHVVNVDVPEVPDTYIHRVGRTARAQALGDAITFVAPDEEDDLRAIERAISHKIPRASLDGFDLTPAPRAAGAPALPAARRGARGGRGRPGRSAGHEQARSPRTSAASRPLTSTATVTWIGVSSDRSEPGGAGSAPAPRFGGGRRRRLPRRR